MCIGLVKVFQEEVGHKGGPDDKEAVHWKDACKDTSETLQLD